MNEPMQVRLIWTHAPGVERPTTNSETRLAAIERFDNETYQKWEDVSDYFSTIYHLFDENLDDYEYPYNPDPADSYIEDCCWFSDDFAQRIKSIEAIDRMDDEGLPREVIAREAAKLFQPIVDEANRIRGLELIPANIPKGNF